MSRRRPVILRETAEAEIDQIAQFLAQSSLNVAFGFYDAVDETTRMLAWMPRLGKRRIARDPELAELRSWSVRGFSDYLIFYLPRKHRSAARRARVARSATASWGGPDLKGDN
jgi:plasmid stabilization system protein ParE